MRARSCVLPADVASVGEARRFVTNLLRGRDPDALDEVVLMVSELATNAVCHAMTGFELLFTIDDQSQTVRMEVLDYGAGDPMLSTSDLLNDRHRGLQIVDHLADNWGIREHVVRPGKSVWFEKCLGPSPVEVRS